METRFASARFSGSALSGFILLAGCLITLAAAAPGIYLPAALGLLTLISVVETLGKQLALENIRVTRSRWHQTRALQNGLDHYLHYRSVSDPEAIWRAASSDAVDELTGEDDAMTAQMANKTPSVMKEAALHLFWNALILIGCGFVGSLFSGGASL